MASIRKRNNRWQVQIRRQSFPALTKTFLSKKNAQSWARKMENLLEEGLWKPLSKDNEKTIYDLMTTYLDKVTPIKKGRVSEKRRLTKLLQYTPLMAVQLKNAQPSLFSAFRDERIKDGVRTTQYDLVLLRHAWNVAMIEWGWDLAPNPLAKIRFPKPNPPRERRLLPWEWERIQESAPLQKPILLWPAILLAIETGLRRSEILSLEWKDWQCSKKQLHVLQTKNGRPRWIPLTTRARNCLINIPNEHNKIFPLNETCLRQGWERLLQKTQIKDLTFHDLRHEAISRWFEKGLSVPEIATLSGHQTQSCLFRYVHISPPNLD